jgi:hypothetical protein
VIDRRTKVKRMSQMIVVVVGLSFVLTLAGDSHPPKKTAELLNGHKKIIDEKL